MATIRTTPTVRGLGYRLDISINLQSRSMEGFADGLLIFLFHRCVLVKLPSVFDSVEANDQERLAAA